MTFDLKEAINQDMISKQKVKDAIKKNINCYCLRNFKCPRCILLKELGLTEQPESKEVSK